MNRTSQQIDKLLDGVITRHEARADIEAEAAREKLAERQCYFIEPKELSDEDRDALKASMEQGHLVDLSELPGGAS